MSHSDGLHLLKGTLELLVLKTLGGDDQLHGFEILDWIRQTTKGDLLVEEGALYPALHRMEQRGLLRSQWGISEKGRRAKYYRLTPEGRSALTVGEDHWARYVTAVRRIQPRMGGT